MSAYRVHGGRDKRDRDEVGSMTEPQDVLAELYAAAGRDMGIEEGETVLLSEATVRAALVRTPETLDVERPWDHAYVAGNDNVCVTCGWQGSYAHTEQFYRKWVWPAVASPSPSPTPPEGLLGSELEKAYRQGFDDGLARRARLAASPAPDPGAGLAEAFREVERATAHLSDAEFDSEVTRLVTEVRAERGVRYRNTAEVTEYVAAPSAKPPETP